MNRNEYLAGHAARRSKIIALLKNQSVKAVSGALKISTQRIYRIRNGTAKSNGYSSTRKPTNRKANP